MACDEVCQQNQLSEGEENFKDYISEDRQLLFGDPNGVSITIGYEGFLVFIFNFIIASIILSIIYFYYQGGPAYAYDYTGYSGYTSYTNDNAGYTYRSLQSSPSILSYLQYVFQLIKI